MCPVPRADAAFLSLTEIGPLNSELYTLRCQVQRIGIIIGIKARATELSLTKRVSLIR